ncbi:MAG: DUF898 domain-containing protein [Deferribacteres bacterium]|nr:DUF898 domain-containing protein [Deferribacteres bacterium]
MFTGSAGEFFRIWIVNTFLTILTLGLYAPWAKVRERRFFYQHTVMDGQPFDYTAHPVALLRGYLIVGGGILLYYLAEAYNPLYSLMVFGIFSLVLPFLIYKSLRFFARHSVYRNIPFHFRGTLGESYKTYLLYPMLIPFTFGLIIPYWAFQRKKYFFGNIGFGTTANIFQGSAREFYKLYGLVVVLLVVIIFFSIPILMSFATMIPAPEAGIFNAGMIFFILSIYFTTLVVSTFVQQYIYAWTTNYCLGHSELGNIRFQSTLKAKQLFWIRITNILAIIFSVGLLIPWAKVRRTRYIIDNLTVIAGQGLDEFTAGVRPDESAYGDVATDFFDIDIGL